MANLCGYHLHDGPPLHMHVRPRNFVDCTISSQFPMNDAGTNPVNFSILVILAEPNEVLAAERYWSPPGQRPSGEFPSQVMVLLLAALISASWVSVSSGTSIISFISHRSPRRSSANAACSGLKPPPAGRLRRANILHLSHSTTSTMLSHLHIGHLSVFVSHRQL